MAIVLEAATPARSDRAVVFAADGSYLRFAAFAAAQIAALPGGRDFDICICAPEALSPAPRGVRPCRVAAGGIFAGLGRDGRRSEADEEGAVLLARLVDRERVERRRREDVARADVELGAVAGADDDAVVELPLGERALLVRARVVEGDPAAGRSSDADGAPFDVDLAERPRRPLAGGADRVPGSLAHPRTEATLTGASRPREAARSRVARRAQGRRGARPRARPPSGRSRDAGRARPGTTLSRRPRRRSSSRTPPS